MHLSVTFAGLGYKNLSKCIESEYQGVKLLGPHVWLEVNNEILHVEHTIVSVFYGRRMYVCMYINLDDHLLHSIVLTRFILNVIVGL